MSSCKNYINLLYNEKKEVINIKKYLITIIVLAFFFALNFSFSPALAKNEDKVKGPKTNVVEVENGDDEDLGDEGEEEGFSMGKSAAALLKNSLRKLERLQEKVNDPEIGNQIQETMENQEEAQEEIEENLEAMDARPGFLKLILGPAYKNAGEVRSQIVHLRNQEKQLIRIKEKLGDADAGLMDTAIAEVQQATEEIKATLDDKLSGFSLFGWLSRFLAGYIPVEPIEPTETPEATVEPTGTPEATVEPTGTPEATPIETIEPTTTPEATPET